MEYVETPFQRWLRWHEGEVVLTFFMIVIAAGVYFTQ
jgi:hypothetical protein